jgi:post-segregation antitoxin (ccd killing protein)
MPRKTKLTLTIDSHMLALARKKKINLAEAFENALRRLGCEDPAAQEARWAKWREDYREAIEQSNRPIEKHGLWLGNLANSKKSKRSSKKSARPTT